METKKFNYEAPEAVVFGVETQEHFLASGGFDSPRGNGYGFDEELEG